MDVIELTEGRRTIVILLLGRCCWLLLLLLDGTADGAVALSVFERLPQMSSFLSELSIV